MKKFLFAKRFTKLLFRWQEGAIVSCVVCHITELIQNIIAV